MARFAISLWVFPFLLCASVSGAVGPTGPADASLPVRSVALFSSGVGYFEHAGTVSGDATAELRFKTGQINDVLKSLVLQDLGGGTAGVVTYPSQDPLAKTLRSFQVDLTGNPSLADLLNQLRGARVAVTAAGEKTEGTVVGVEVRQKPAGDKGELGPVPILNLVVGPSLRSLPLDQIREIEVVDPGLRDELGRALEAVAQARDQEKKPVTLSFRGSGERRVRVGYVVETPVWKTSYRLILPADREAKPRVQGWAILENQTDSDWSGVRLSLVSGRPISFVQDLYRPLYVQRPVVQPELYGSLRPLTYETGLAAAPAEAKAKAELYRERSPRKAAMAAEMAVPSPATPGYMSGETTEPMDASASVAPLAAAAKVGELFEYVVEGVTLPRQRSAMIPIVADEVEAERVSIYNAAVLPRNPLAGARLKNTTGKHLLQGPVTVLDGGGYGGDARIDDLPPGQERFLSYGIDQQVVVDSTKGREEAAVQTGRIVKGVLQITRKQVATREYAAENRSDREKVLVIEHPFRQGWKLAGDEKPQETTETLYRFRETLGAGKSRTLAVREEIVLAETIALLGSDPGQLAYYSRSGEIPRAVRDALAKAMQLKQAVVDVDREIERKGAALGEISQEQERIRENLKTVDQGSQYANRLLSKLNEQETAVEKLQAEREELGKKREARQRELEAYLNELTVG